MKVIIIGPSLSGKTSLVRFLRENTKLPVAEIDEELTRLNHGTYPLDEKHKREVLGPKVIARFLSNNAIIFLTNTDYFTIADLRAAKNTGFTIGQLKCDLTELKRRNTLRVANEGYADLSQWLAGMVAYQEALSEQGLFDFTLDATLPTEKIAADLLQFAQAAMS